MYVHIHTRPNTQDSCVCTKLEQQRQQRELYFTHTTLQLKGWAFLSICLSLFLLFQFCIIKKKPPLFPYLSPCVYSFFSTSLPHTQKWTLYPTFKQSTSIIVTHLHHQHSSKPHNYISPFFPQFDYISLPQSNSRIHTHKETSGAPLLRSIAHTHTASSITFISHLLISRLNSSLF